MLKNSIIKIFFWPFCWNIFRVNLFQLSTPTSFFKKESLAHERLEIVMHENIF